MKGKAILAITVAALLPMFASGTVTQHEQHHPQQQAQEKSQSPMMGEGMMGQQMMAHHKQTQKIVEQLMQNLSALEQAPDMATVKTKLAEQRLLLEQLQQDMQQRGQIMRKMAEHMDTCPMMGKAQKPE